MSPTTRRLTLTHYIFIGMGVGVLLGFVFPDSARNADGFHRLHRERKRRIC